MAKAMAAAAMGAEKPTTREIHPDKNPIHLPKVSFTLAPAPEAETAPEAPAEPAEDAEPASSAPPPAAPVPEPDDDDDAQGALHMADEARKKKLMLGGAIAGGIVLIVIIASALSGDDEPEAETAQTAAASASPAPAAPTAPAPTATSTVEPPGDTAADDDAADAGDESGEPKITFVCEPGCDKIACDGKALRDWADGVELKPGTHSCVGVKKGFAPIRRKIKVTAVQEMELPEATDDWVSENLGEFETVDEWRASLRESMTEMRLGQARQMLMGGVSEALAGLVDDDPPEALVDSDLNQRVQGTMQQFQAQGIDFGQWMEATGQEPEQFIESMRGQSGQAVKVDLALRAVADAEAIEVDGAELEAEYARMAMQYGQKAKEIRKAYETNDAVPDLVAQIRTSKAMDWLLHSVEFVDPAGAPIDRDLLLGHSHDEDEDDHDHDHDHDEDEAGTAGQSTDETEKDES